jgi:transposase
MRRTNTITTFHKNAPKKLIALYRKNGGSCRAVGMELEVSAASVWKLLKFGREPRREELRRKLLLPHKLSPEERTQKRKALQEQKELLDRQIEKHFEQVMEALHGRSN